MKEEISLIVTELRRELEAVMGDDFYINANKGIGGDVRIEIVDTKTDFVSLLNAPDEIISSIQTLGEARAFVKNALDIHSHFPYLAGNDESLLKSAVCLISMAANRVSCPCTYNVRKEPTETFVDFRFYNYIKRHMFPVTVQRNTFNRNDLKITVKSIIREVNVHLEKLGAKARCKDPFEDEMALPAIPKKDAPITHKTSHIKPNVPGFGAWG